MMNFIPTFLKSKGNFIGNLRLVGTVELWLEDEEGNITKSLVVKNLIVNTGIEFILDLLINNISYYSGNTRIRYMALGSINAAPSEYEWRLRGEGTVNDGGSILRVELDPETSRIGQSIEFHGVFSEGDFPTLPYNIKEMGAFLGDRPPLNNPQLDSTQRPYAMFNRIVLPEEFTKYKDGTALRFRYTLETEAI